VKPVLEHEQAGSNTHVTSISTKFRTEIYHVTQPGLVD